MPPINADRLQWIAATLVLGLAFVMDPVGASVDLAGRVLDDEGKPLGNASVYIYTAEPRVGTSPYCPSCYADCGKSGRTRRDGSFRIPTLSESLLFRVLVTAPGREPTFVRKIDPRVGPIVAKLARRDLKRFDRRLALVGRVVDAKGNPVLGAVVIPVGYRRGDTTRFGMMPGTDPLSISDERGHFAIITKIPEASWFLRVTARGLAPRMLQEVTPKRLRIELTDGATVTGRIVGSGGPLRGVGVGIVQADRRANTFLGGEEIGTDDQGRFVFSNVAQGHTYLVFAKMSTMGSRGAVPAESLLVATGATTVNAGDLEVRPAYRLRGRVVLSDGNMVPPGTRALLGTPDGSDAIVVPVGVDGRFEGVGLSADSMRISVSVSGYRLSPNNAGFNVISALSMSAYVAKDVAELEVLLEPGPPGTPGVRTPAPKGP